MHILGLANGTPGGNSEILLKAALTAATEANLEITTAYVHLPSIVIPVNPAPLSGSLDVSLGSNSAISGKGMRSSDAVDDRSALLNAILDADALIFATPVYSHQPAGTLKGVLDRILGPYTDVSFATQAAKKKKAGDPRFKDMRIDPRLLRPRVALFIAVAGSTLPDQVTMALPTLHLMVYPLHAKVVDQIVLMGYGDQGSVVSRFGGEGMSRAQQLGRNVVSQVGKHFDDADYLGPEPPGACPYCHLAKIDLFCSQGNGIGCVTCGAEGKLVMDDDGTIRPVWKENSALSSITMAGKFQHTQDIITAAKAERKEIDADPDHTKKLEYWRGVQIKLVDLPSSVSGDDTKFPLSTM